MCVHILYGIEQGSLELSYFDLEPQSQFGSDQAFLNDDCSQAAIFLPHVSSAQSAIIVKYISLCVVQHPLIRL